MTHKKAFSVLAIVFVLGLPPVIWWQGLTSPAVGFLLVAIGTLQLLGARSGFSRLQGIIALMVAAFIAAGSQHLVLYYPVLINCTLLLLWFYSWLYPPTIIERFASRFKVVSNRKRHYMRNLTLAWCLVFLVNLTAALITAMREDLNWWVAWNGLGAYLLVGLFAGGELLFRKCVHERAEQGRAV